MGNSAFSQGSSTGTHEGDVGTSILEEQHDWPIEQAADIPDTQSLQEMRNPYITRVLNIIRIPEDIFVWVVGPPAQCDHC